MVAPAVEPVLSAPGMENEESYLKLLLVLLVVIVVLAGGLLIWAAL